MNDLVIEIMDIANKLPLGSQRILRNFAQDLYQDPDSILTKEETKEIKENIESGFINSKAIDWDHFEDLEI